MRFDNLCGVTVAVGLAVMATSATAETFTLVDGSVVDGTAIRSLGATLTIRLDGAGMLQIPLHHIERVDILTENGTVIAGSVETWSKGVYHLITNEGPLRVGVVAGRATRIATGSSSPTVTATPAAPAQEETGPDVIRAGFIYTGSIDDGGWTYQQEQGRLALERMPSVASTMAVTIDFADDDQFREAIGKLIDEGSNVIFAANHVSPDMMTEAAALYDDVIFIGCGDVKPAVNIGVYCSKMHDARYLTGIIAGTETRSNILGYVAAFPEPYVIRDINAFALGAQAVNPRATVIVEWTKTWYGPGIEREKAAKLIDRGADVLTIAQDSPAALQIVEQQGKLAIGYQGDMSIFAPAAMLTSAIWDWGTLYHQVVNELEQGAANVRPRWLGLEEGVVGLAPLADHVSPELAKLVKRLQQELIDGQRHVFTGPIRDVDGDIRLTEGKIMPNSRLLGMDFFVEGVIGASATEP